MSDNLKKDLKQCKKADEASLVQASAELTDEQLDAVAGGLADILDSPDKLADKAFAAKKLASRPLDQDDGGIDPGLLLHRL